MARPSEFTQEIADTICQSLAEGNSLRSICEADDMPSKATVLNWLLNPARAAFFDQYARARELQADTHVDEMPDIADDSSNDYMTKVNGDGTTTEQLNSENIQRSRLRIDTRKWIAERMRPKKYGAKVALTDGEGGPLVVQVLKLADQEAQANADNPAT
ncbi:terminase small subunit protein [Mesorhizobium sp. M7A.F.Ca.CA.001.07.2.1]|uniref:terminase small subunit-like protein n=1 Tax=Mesorhizobium sp. M7A.F.Ca.CA.001.07.2.1 TaxID=2496684 RepID=UPI000FD1E9B0|nr:terminase small subunit protein [Mesorhizobium sp. M7A.F.Ca.CA.001.07.2.1]RVB31956.1 terminase small subunit protein [Mesorhizobium sp. M7A.F.Ca.CA.001.07.2.1]